jgi:hypothetical protein
VLLIITSERVLSTVPMSAKNFSASAALKSLSLASPVVG